MKTPDTIKTLTPLPYRLTNDYLFRAVFQSKPKALEGLCRSVLHLPQEDTVTVTLRNPIELGKRMENKEFILDLAVTVNNSVYLNHTELATEEDKSFGTDLWAKVFKAENWEEINMLAKQNEYLQEAVAGVAVLTADEQIRQQCQAREDFEYWERIRENGHKRELSKLQQELEEKDKALAGKDQEIASLKAQLSDLEASSQEN